MVAILPQITITTAAANQLGPTFQFRKGSPRSMALQANFTYGSGGTTVTAWIQSSIDGGTTWSDNGRFALTTSTARQGLNISSLTSVTSAATLNDAGGSVQDGIIGSLVRVKYTTTGTYAGNTTLQIDCISDGLTAAPAGVHE